MTSTKKFRMAEPQRTRMAACFFASQRPTGFRGLAVIVAVLLGAGWPARAEPVTPATAREVAQGWVATVVRVRGSWGAANSTQVRDVRPLRQEGKLVGYYCEIQPGGYVVVAPYEGLSPVKAYATSGRLDPESSQGMSDVIKLRLQRQVKALEDKVGPLDQARPAQIKGQLKTDFTGHWQTLRSAAAAGGTEPRTRLPVEGAYTGGRVLLSTAWEQGEPYNSQCPSGDGCSHTLVGCVPVAAAQIMRYWSWPSWGRTYPYNDQPYDWSHMPDQISTNSDPGQIDAIARLGRHAGMAASVDYGCDDTVGYVWFPGSASMDDAFDEQFRYDVGGYTTPPGYGPIKDELNYNEPILYAISTSWTGGHSFVVDGWAEFTEPPTRWLHVNYGWGQFNTLGWVNADEDMPEADGGWADLRLNNVVPEDAVYSTVAGDYPKGDWPAYRYFNVHAAGDSANFAAGQSLQFLPTLRLTGSATDGRAITIRGVAGDTTRLLSQGDRSRGIVIYDGAIRLANGGWLSLCPMVPPRYLEKGNYGPNGVSLSWERPLGHDTHTVIERQVHPNTTWKAIATVPSAQTSYRDTNVPPSFAHSYRVRSTDGKRLSEASREVFARYP